MKSITQIKHTSQYISIPCSKCKKHKNINKHYFNKKKNKLTFCSEKCRVYFYDSKQETIMSYLNTPHFHYLIGLIATDGHIGYPGCTQTTKTYYCNIKLHKTDKKIIDKIKDIFGGKVYLEGKNTVTWRVSNIDFIQYLKNIGMTNNKTYDINVNDYFNSLTNENKNAFIRGVIDGDGSINMRTRSKTLMQCGFNICSASKIFINMIDVYFNNAGVLHERIANQNDKATCSLFYYYINGKKIIEALEPIYKNLKENDLYIERKYNTYNCIKGYFVS